MAIAARSPDDGSAAWGGTFAVASRGNRTKLRVGNGAATLETRYQLLEQLRSSHALDRHEWFVFTRPDVYFLCDHPPASSWWTDGITVPGPVCSRLPPSACRGRMQGPDYINDRHAIMPRKHVGAYLGTLHAALRETVQRGKLWCGEKRPADHFDGRAECCCTTERLLSRCPATAA